LRQLKVAVFSLEDVCRIGGVDRLTGSVYVHRMLKKELIKRIQRGKYSITDDPFLVSSQLVYPSYISFLSALYLHGKLEQVIDTIYIISPHKRPRCEVFGMKVRFVRFPPNLVFGFKKVRKGEGYVSLAEPEKAVVDSLPS